LVQAGNTEQMIHTFDDIVSFVSNYFTLKVGDLIYTGTPAGVGKIEIGDVLQGAIGDQQLLHCEIK
jgi:acylpyruvate hydrolase